MSAPPSFKPKTPPSFKPRQALTKDERHPDMESLGGRFLRSKVLEMGAEDQIASLKQHGFEAERQPDDTVNIRRPGERDWHKLDPSRFELIHDVLDFIPYGAELAAAAPLTAKAATAATAATGPIGGAIAGSLAFGGQMAAMEALKQGAMKAMGEPISLKGAASRVGEEALYGAAGELGGRAVVGAGKAVLGAARGVGGAVKTAAEKAAYSFDETSKAFQAAKAAGKDARGMLEKRVLDMGGDASKLPAMTDDQLINEFVIRQPGAGLREKSIVEQSGKFIDERVGQDLDILTRRRGDKFSKVTGEKMASAGDLRHYPQARYGPYEGTKSLDEIKEAFKGIPDSDIRAFIQKEFGEARPIIVERAKILKSGARGKPVKQEVTLHDMPRSELFKWMHANQKGLVKGEAGTSRAKDLKHDLRDMLEINKPTFEMGNSWREVDLRGIQRMSDKAGKALDFTKPGVHGKVARFLMGARGPLKRDLMGVTGQGFKKVGRAAQWPIRAARNVAGIGPGGGYLVTGIGAAGGAPLAATAVKAGLMGAVAERFGEVLARDKGNIGSQLLAHLDLPVRAARKIQAALEALKSRGVDSYRIAMQGLARDPEFREWLESKS